MDCGLMGKTYKSRIIEKNTNISVLLFFLNDHIKTLSEQHNVLMRKITVQIGFLVVCVFTNTGILNEAY